ncbi:MAG: alkene reductase [Zetaproteobacteria bacterium]|nr:alkene reductase [Zetaproteobacteria bacterium]
MENLFSPGKIGSLEVKNRIFMAPLTRSRATADGVPSEYAKQYYAQRASAGLIITEATQISAQGKGYVDTPGIYTADQVRAWAEVTAAVHQAGGKIFIQLWHVGRISHISLLPEGHQPVAPSAIRAKAQTFTAEGLVDVSEPRELRVEEIQAIVVDYKHAAQQAKVAGFDGVEIHAANGYLIDQFIRDRTNQRTDLYGGTVENRARFLLEVFDAVAKVWDPGRIGLRFAPTISFNDIEDSNPRVTFGTIFRALGKRRAAYLHVCEGALGMAESSPEDREVLEHLRGEWDGFYIANGGHHLESAQQYLHSGRAQAISFGRAFLANPDLPARLQAGAGLNDPDESTFYGGDQRGYTDYPTMR